jgi:hypothetical protein
MHHYIEPKYHHTVPVYTRGKIQQNTISYNKDPYREHFCMHAVGERINYPQPLPPG